MALPQDFYDDDTGSPLPQQQYGDSEQSGPPGPAGPPGPSGASTLAIDTSAIPSAGYACAQDAGVASKAAKAISDAGIEQALVLGFYDGTAGQLVTTGSLVNEVHMTTAGGPPIIGQMLYLAAHADDGGTGDGKLTATPPFTPGYVVAPVAVCMDNANYAGAKTCKVAPLLQTPYYIVNTGIPITGGG